MYNLALFLRQYDFYSVCNCNTKKSFTFDNTLKITSYLCFMYHM